MIILGRARKHFVLTLLKVSTRRNFIESYHFILKRRRSRPKSRLALFGRIILTKGSFYKLASGDLTSVHFLTFDYKRFYKLISSSVSKKIEINPIVKDLLSLPLYTNRRWSYNRNVFRPDLKKNFFPEYTRKKSSEKNYKIYNI